MLGLGSLYAKPASTASPASPTKSPCKHTPALFRPLYLHLTSMPLAVRSTACARLPMLGTLPDRLGGAAAPRSGKAAGSGNVSNLQELEVEVGITWWRCGAVLRRKTGECAISWLGILMPPTQLPAHPTAEVLA